MKLRSFAASSQLKLPFCGTLFCHLAPPKLLIHHSLFSSLFLLFGTNVQNRVWTKVFVITVWDELKPNIFQTVG